MAVERKSLTMVPSSPGEEIRGITFLCRSLDRGGAERQLVELAKGLHRHGIQVNVVTFYRGGAFEGDLAEAGVPLCSLNKKGRWEVFSFLARLGKIVRSSRSEALYAFLGMPCILSLSARLVRPRQRVVWGVRASNMDLSRYDWLARLSYRLECVLSRFADLVIVNSHAGREHALKNGFPPAKTVVVENGIDTDRFCIDVESGRAVREEWSVAEHEVLVGIVGRLDPMKDHPVFLQAASVVSRQSSGVRFVCVGDGPEAYSSEMNALATGLGLDANLVWAGARDDMVAVYNAIDILVSSSYGEGFPNVIAEAMACGTPCVVTDVGDSSRIVGDRGYVVPPKDPEALAEKILLLIAAVRNNGIQVEGNRQHIIDNFSNDALVIKTVRAIGGRFG